MAPLFSKRLSCFYCGRRTPQLDKGPVRKWRCKNCEAINYLDEKGEITDPPAAETNPQVYGPGASSPAFESSDFTGSGLFCAQCVRNQHLFTCSLASYFPSPEDPNYSAYEREYPKFRKNLEERYPQVCVKCEPLVKARIRQTGYEAKSDHLRRMMDRSKAGRAARHARNWNWRSLLVFAGAVGYWTSIAGQLSWDAWSALAAAEPLRDSDNMLVTPSISSCVYRAMQEREVPSDCMVDLAPYAGLSLIAGILSLWYNPKLRLKVEGRGGRFVGLGEYYQAQLIIMVVRCAFWAVLRDPSSSGLEANVPPSLHLFMIGFTIVSVAVSRRIVKYDTRPLVTWSEEDAEETQVSTPTKQPAATPGPSTARNQVFTTPSEGFQTARRFPFEKLSTPRPTPATEISIPTPPPEDDMDWTPSVQHNIRPTVHQRDQPSVLDGPLPFYGSLPAAPQPPSWNLRNRANQRQKPIEQVVEPNPFHRSPTQTPAPWRRNDDCSENIFAPPKFFPKSDYVASTGLESLFDQTFTIKTPEDEDDNPRQQQQQRPYTRRSQRSADLMGTFVFQYVRLGLLIASLVGWLLSQYDHLSVPGNYIEVTSLGSASLIAGFGLLEMLKQPIANWNGMEILVSFAELVAAVHLGGHLPRGDFERQYFDRYGKFLLIFMAVQEALGLLHTYQIAGTDVGGHQQQQPYHQKHQPGSPPRRTISDRPEFQSFTSQTPTEPPLSFSSTAAGSSFSTQPAEPQYHSAFSPLDGSSDKDHGFSLSSLKGHESDASDPLDRDSDTETTVTTATTATNNTIRNIRYGRDPSSPETFFSPKRNELGPGIGGLSLDDKPRRITRSQTQKFQPGGGRIRGLR